MKELKRSVELSNYVSKDKNKVPYVNLLKEVCELDYSKNENIEFNYIKIEEGNNSFEEKGGVLYTKGCEVLIKASCEVTNVVIDENTKKIAPYAFRGCNELEEVIIPEGVEEIGTCAFDFCIELKEADLPSSVKIMEDCVFAHCASLESCDLSKTKIKKIDCTFVSCKKLSSISLPETLEVMNQGFYNCYALTSITIPRNVKELERGNFAYCITLKDVIFEKGSSLKVVGENNFRNCINLEQINLPDTVETIGENCFGQCARLTSFTLPPLVTKLPEFALNSCKSLKNFNYTNNLKEISLSAFDCCVRLRKLFINDSVEVFKNDSDNDCFSLVEVSPNNKNYKCINNVLYDNDGNIVYIPSLMEGELVLKDGIEEINYEIKNAFVNHSFNISSISLPSTFKDMDISFLSLFKQLKEIKVSEDNPYYKSLDGVLYSKHGKIIHFIPFNKEDSLTLSGEENLSPVLSYVKDIKIKTLKVSKDVKKLPLSFISSLPLLEKIEVDKENPHYKSISGILYNKKGSKLLVLPLNFSSSFVIEEECEEFSEYVLNYYKSLESISIEGNNKCFFIKDGMLFNKKDRDFLFVTPLSSDTFTIPSFYTKNDLYPHFEKNCVREIGEVPEEVYHTFSHKTTHDLRNMDSYLGMKKRNVKIYGDREEALYYFPFLNKETENEKIEDSVLSLKEEIKELKVEEGNKKYLAEEGLLYSKDGKTLLYCPKGKEGTVVVRSGTKRINMGAFYNCKKITEIIIPSTVEEINDFAFAYCEKLTSIYLPENLKRFSKGLFMGCKSLETINIPQSVETFDNYVFSFCTSLHFIELPLAMKVFNTESFYGVYPNFHIDNNTEDNIVAVISEELRRSISFGQGFNKVMNEYIQKEGNSLTFFRCH